VYKKSDYDYQEKTEKDYIPQERIPAFQDNNNQTL
jgi:hypothetical protein